VDLELRNITDIDDQIEISAEHQILK